eukprot:CAMPEP_0202884648 /NCGR_PEP_ID=MMETSP1391-20130828/41249_1 /ASSEMBLY_ACC=CAM_ASM_000867 /TAXON_ID=1034604 /ORGANISM="Chlamydomonas leiostraca, Strain SAG 11-49" /LENGTH=159 /DNA_ID=CAMNT_0049567867 /DNA_START=281 /DNA_END=760 /DNA_ORIENTATION=+
MNTWLARTSVSPAAPCWSVSRNTVTEGSDLNCATASLAPRPLCPSPTHLMPFTARARLTRSSAGGKVENTSDLVPGSLARSSSRRRSSASILVIHDPSVLTRMTSEPSGGESSGLWPPPLAARLRATTRNASFRATSRRHMGQLGRAADMMLALHVSQK